MPSANTLPVRIRLAALTMSSGVTWLSVPIWSSLPQRPQFESFFEASAIACFADLDVHERFPSFFSLSLALLKPVPMRSRNIALGCAVFHQAGALTDRLRQYPQMLDELIDGRAERLERQREEIIMKRNLIAALAAALCVALALPAHAANIVDEWASVKAPAAPALKPVTVDPKTTALLMLDFMNQNCGKRPRCVATIPAMKKLLDEARAAKATVVYSYHRQHHGGRCDQGRGAACGRAVSAVGPDKFLKTDLEKILKDKGITTVIAVGTASNGAVLYTGSGAASAA